jgi:hypothetical protein
VFTDVTQYTVSCLPIEHRDRSDFEITVAWRAPGSWAVLNRSGYCLGRDGEWDWEIQPSSRADEWKAMFRFSLDTALKLAAEAAPKLKVMHLSVQDALDGKHL